MMEMVLPDTFSTRVFCLLHLTSLLPKGAKVLRQLGILFIFEQRRAVVAVAVVSPPDAGGGLGGGDGALDALLGPVGTTTVAKLQEALSTGGRRRLHFGAAGTASGAQRRAAYKECWSELMIRLVTSLYNRSRVFIYYIFFQRQSLKRIYTYSSSISSNRDTVFYSTRNW